jgi:hypothetical protein
MSCPCCPGGTLPGHPSTHSSDGAGGSEQAHGLLDLPPRSCSPKLATNSARRAPRAERRHNGDVRASCCSPRCCNADAAAQFKGP